jgi:hypothetical protein
MASRYDNLRTSASYQQESMVNVDLQPLRRVGEIFMALTERDRVPKVFSDHYWWMFSYRDEIQAALERLLA